MKNWNIWGICLLVSVLSASCSLFDREETLPVFLDLRESQVLVDEETQGVMGLRDMWLDHNGEDFGVHRLPRVIPFLPQEGDNDLVISGGIFENGLSSVRSAYPFWQPISLNIDADPLDTVVVNPVFEYYPRDSILIYRIEESFEGGNTDEFVSNRDLPNPAVLEATTFRAFDGQWSGVVRIRDNAYQFEALSRDFYDFPRGTDNDVYMEITYRNDVPFTVGLFYTNLSATDVRRLPIGVGFLSEDEWTTTYVHLYPLIQSVEEIGVFKPYFQADGEDSETGNIITGNIYIDKIRILHFK